MVPANNVLGNLSHHTCASCHTNWNGHSWWIAEMLVLNYRVCNMKNQLPSFGKLVLVLGRT